MPAHAKLTITCDSPHCSRLNGANLPSERVFDLHYTMGVWIEKGLVRLLLKKEGWKITIDDKYYCPTCAKET